MPGPNTIFLWAVLVFLQTKERALFDLVDAENLPAESRLFFHGMKDKASALRIVASHPTAAIIRDVYANFLTSADFSYVEEFLKSFPENKRKGKVHLGMTEGTYSIELDVLEHAPKFIVEGDVMTVTVVDHAFTLKIPQIAGNFKKWLDYQFTGVTVNSTAFIEPFLRYDRALAASAAANSLAASLAASSLAASAAVSVQPFPTFGGAKPPPSDKIVRSLLDELPLQVKQSLHLVFDAAGRVESFTAVPVRLYLDTALELARQALLYRNADSIGECKVLIEVYDHLKQSPFSNEGVMMLEVAFFIKMAVERTSVAADGGFISLEDAESSMQKALRTRSISTKSFKLPQNSVHEFISFNVRKYCDTGVNDRLRVVSVATGAH
jgi:hypothetical protein